VIAVEEAWQTALATATSTATLWIHGDVHARNTLVEGGKITGIIDWGDVTSGDAATDLASIWGYSKTPPPDAMQSNPMNRTRICYVEKKSEMLVSGPYYLTPA